MIKTNHESLKYLLEQRIHSPIQQKGITKLRGLKYFIQYKQGKENGVADALSRRLDAEVYGVNLQEVSEIIDTEVYIPNWCRRTQQ